MIDTTYYADHPLRVPCPRCGALRGAPCHSQTTSVAPHARRTLESKLAWLERRQAAAVAALGDLPMPGDPAKLADWQARIQTHQALVAALHGLDYRASVAAERDLWSAVLEEIQETQ